MNYDEREDIAQMDIDDDTHGGFEPAFISVPPGLEGFNISHEGGEYEDYEEFMEVMQGKTSQYTISTFIILF